MKIIIKSDTLGTCKNYLVRTSSESHPEGCIHWTVKKVFTVFKSKLKQTFLYICSIHVILTEHFLPFFWWQFNSITVELQ